VWTREDAACILNTVTLLSVLYTFVLWFGFGVLFWFFFYFTVIPLTQVERLLMQLILRLPANFQFLIKLQTGSYLKPSQIKKFDQAKGKNFLESVTTVAFPNQSLFRQKCDL